MCSSEHWCFWYHWLFLVIFKILLHGYEVYSIIATRYVTLTLFYWPQPRYVTTALLFESTARLIPFLRAWDFLSLVKEIETPRRHRKKIWHHYIPWLKFYETHIFWRTICHPYFKTSADLIWKLPKVSATELYS